MFDDTLLDSSPVPARRVHRRLRATALAGFTELAGLGMLVLVPLLGVHALPEALERQGRLLPPPPAVPEVRENRVRVTSRVSMTDLLRTPVRIPKTVARVQDAIERPAPSIAEPVGDVPGVVPGGFLAGLANLPPPPSPRVAKPHPTARVRVGGRVEAARAIFQPMPVYPPLARMARIEGTVRLEAIISRDGTIETLRVLSGHPLFFRAAIEAVSRWRYRPTLLNGEPVEVQTEIDVDFNLAE